MQFLRLALIAIISIGNLGCSEATNGTGMISQRIGEIARTPGTNEVDLSKLTTFGWEYFYALPPGSTRDDVCNFIRAGRNVCGRIVRIEKAPSDHMYLLFGLNGQLTHIELHAVENGQFDMQFPDGGQPRQKAVFKIRRSSTTGGKEAIILEPR
jgi:hypothetical protein